MRRTTPSSVSSFLCSSPNTLRALTRPHLLAGYFITLFRLAIISLLAVGRALTLLPTLRQSLGVPELGTDGFEVEQAVFAFGMVVAYALAAMWYAWLFHMPSAQVSGAKKAV